MFLVILLQSTLIFKKISKNSLSYQQSPSIRYQKPKIEKNKMRSNHSQGSGRLQVLRPSSIRLRWMCATQSVFARYQATVLRNPLSKLSRGRQPSSRAILLASMA